MNQPNISCILDPYVFLLMKILCGTNDDDCALNTRPEQKAIGFLMLGWRFFLRKSVCFCLPILQVILRVGMFVAS